jgi:hypothetical protein
MDALEESQSDELAQSSDVEALIARLRSREWEPAPAVGLGQELRLDPDAETHASALMFQDSMLHGSVVVAS